MPLVCADSSPLRYLILIGEARLLPLLYGNILIPSIVFDELRHSRTPSMVKDWMDDCPPWLHVVADEPALVLPSNELDPGELATIRLASYRGADLILMDDRDAVRFAREELGFAVTGTLGVLDRAAALGYVAMSGAIDKLRTTNFRARPELLSGLLAKHGDG